MENTMVAPQNIKNKIIVRSSNSISEYIPPKPKEGIA
jgi:hypothetical protein